MRTPHGSRLREKVITHLQASRNSSGAAEHRSDVVQILYCFCLVDLCQPVCGLSRVSRAREYFWSESCHMWPLIKLVESPHKDLPSATFACTIRAIIVTQRGGTELFSNYTKPLGFHTTDREPKRAHWRVPAFKHTTKNPREDSQREKERKGSERGKKERNFGRSGRSAVPGRGSGGGRGGPAEEMQNKFKKSNKLCAKIKKVKKITTKNVENQKKEKMMEGGLGSGEWREGVSPPPPPPVIFTQVCPFSFRSSGNCPRS